MKNRLSGIALFAALVAVVPASAADSIAGIWDASIVFSDIRVPFRMEFQGTGKTLHADFFNGDERVPSTSGSFDGKKVTLGFDYYGSHLDAELTESGSIEGAYQIMASTGKRVYSFRAVPHKNVTVAAGSVPSIAGLWRIPTTSAKGEHAWHLLIRQNGAEASGAILRIDGDTGAFGGTFENGSFFLSHFSGARPLLLVATPQPDGSLELIQNGKTKMKAIRAEQAQAQALPAPDDPMEHTTMKDASKPLVFRYPDLDGKMVSNTDERFRGKVVLVTIGGSWCPNCHDEAPFLAELYKKYRSQGLEVVMLAFEEEESLKDLVQIKAFAKHYGIEYPVLATGTPADLNDRLPGVANLNSWPTTFFIGRNGKVEAIHTGFAGKATGVLHEQMAEEINATLARMLAEPVPSSAGAK